MGAVAVARPAVLRVGVKINASVTAERLTLFKPTAPAITHPLKAHKATGAGGVTAPAVKGVGLSINALVTAERLPFARAAHAEPPPAEGRVFAVTSYTQQRNRQD